MWYRKTIHRNLFENEALCSEIVIMHHWIKRIIAIITLHSCGQFEWLSGLGHPLEIRKFIGSTEFSHPLIISFTSNDYSQANDSTKITVRWSISFGWKTDSSNLKVQCTLTFCADLNFKLVNLSKWSSSFSFMMFSVLSFCFPHRGGDMDECLALYHYHYHFEFGTFVLTVPTNCTAIFLIRNDNVRYDHWQ